MNKYLKFTFIAILAGAIGGCAGGLSKQECELADWHSIGFEDGAKGLPQTQVSRHRKNCAEHGIGLQLNEYRDGWQAGIDTYCQPGNAYNLGRKGKSYRGVCPGDVEPAFLAAYGEGRSLYALEQDVYQLNRALKRKHQRMDAIEVEMRDAGLELVANGVPTERRVLLLDSLRKLGDERNQTQTRIAEIESELAHKQYQLDQLSSARAY